MQRLIFLDVDDTLLSPPYDAVKRVSSFFGKKLPPEEAFLNRSALQFYDAFPDVFRNAKEMWLFGLMALPFGYFRSQRPLKFDIPRVGAFLDDHRVYLISKNPPSFARWRLQRLREIFGVSVGRRYVACGPIFSQGPKKIDLIRTIAAERGVPLSDCLIIDDSPESIADAAAAGLPSALIDSTWNKKDQPSLSSSSQVITTEQIPDVMERHLGNVSPDGSATAYVVPPLSVKVASRLALHFLKRRILLGERLPSVRQIYPVARHPRTSMLYRDPQAKTCQRFDELLRADFDPSSLRIVVAGAKTTVSRLPFSALDDVRQCAPFTRVLALRGLCKDIMESKGQSLGPASLFHFRALSRDAEITRLVSSHRVAEAVASHAAKNGKSVEEARALSRAYAHEIAGGRSYLGCLWGWQILSLIFDRVFTRIRVTTHPSIKRLERDHFLIYTSIHRSYLDSGILYTVVAQHTNNFPFIVAADKMRKNWLGRMGAQAGTFFVRRKFVDEIYSAVMAEHVNAMHNSGSSMEVFLEGQRSRSGLTLPPKKGIASIVYSGMSGPVDQKGKVAMVPVSFVYNKLPESEMLISEYHEERKKNNAVSLRESADMKIKRSRRKSAYAKIRSMLRRFTNKPVSECYVSFGEPVVLSRSAQDTPQFLALNLQNSLNEVMYRINASTVALPSSVLCLALLAAEDHHLSREDGVHFLALVRDLIAIYDLPSPAAQTRFGTDWHQQVDEFLHVPFVNRKFKRYRIRENDLLSLSDLDIERATYYKNNILHFFVLPALLASILLQEGAGDTFELHRFLDHMFQKMTLKYFLPKIAKANVVDELLRIFERHGLLAYTAHRYQVDGASSQIRCLNILARVGQEIGQDDLVSQFRAFQRTDSRFDVEVPIRVQHVSHVFSSTSEVLQQSESAFFLRTAEPVSLQDEVRFRPDCDNALEFTGTVVEHGTDGVGVQCRDVLGALLRDAASVTQGGASCVVGKFSRHRNLAVEGVVKSLSTSGALLNIPHAFVKGDIIEAALQKGEHEILVCGRVVRSSGDGVAIRFENLTGSGEARLMSLLASVIHETGKVEVGDVDDAKPSPRQAQELDSDSSTRRRPHRFDD